MKTRLVSDVSPSSGWQLPASLGQLCFHFKVMMLLQIPITRSLGFFIWTRRPPDGLHPYRESWGMVIEGKTSRCLQE